MRTTRASQYLLTVALLPATLLACTTEEGTEPVETVVPAEGGADAGASSVTDETDAGSEATHTGSGPDAGPDRTDAGSQATDAGSEATDAGPNEADSGTETADAGAGADAETDAGADSGLSALQVNAPLELATQSADDYADNEFGVISGATLDRWIEDWAANRPANIEGRLIILQQDSKEGTTQFIRHDGEQVFTYAFAEHAYADSQKRNNGLLDTFATIPDGERTDEILAEFDIDLTRDLVVFAFVDKDAVPGAVVDAPAKATKVWYNTRSWWWLRYWGAQAEHLAILDGAGADVLSEDNIVSEPSELPQTRSGFSVRQLRDDNTALKIDVGELIDLVKEGGDEYRIVDPRRKAEYFGEAFASPVNPVNGLRPVTEGRIKGARFLPWQATLEGVTVTTEPDYAAAGIDVAVDEHALRFKPKAQLQALFDADDLLDYDSAAEDAVTVHYCGHGRRASTWAFVSLGVLGVPARLYDGSWVEWGNLAGGTPEEGGPERPLPADSVWRTDVEELSEYGSPLEPIPGVFYNPASGIVAEVEVTASAAGLEIDAEATATHLIVEADRLYKQ